MTTPPITSWTELQRKYEQFAESGARWIFRGHQDTSWPLRPSLERALDRFEIPFREMRNFEGRLLREFKRHLHRYSQYLPDDKDVLEWLTFLQHHGAPTRLLDWTYSFYVALFFAIENASANQKCAIWAVDQGRCWQLVMNQLPPEIGRAFNEDDKDLEATRWLLEESTTTLVCPLNPLNLNTRLAVQQGNFLVPLDLGRPFQEVFDKSIGAEADCWEKIEIVCSQDLLRKALTELQRMNITEVSLFPGVDGLARSMRHVIPLSHFWKYT